MAIRQAAMKKLTIAAATMTCALVGVASPVAASAASRPSTHSPSPHHKSHAIQQAPCGRKGLGIDIALGTLNLCLPL